MTIRFPDPEPLFPPILQLDEVSFGYTPGQNVLERVNLSANLQSRICIVSLPDRSSSALGLGAVEPLWNGYLVAIGLLNYITLTDHFVDVRHFIDGFFLLKDACIRFIGAPLDVSSMASKGST